MDARRKLGTIGLLLVSPLCLGGVARSARQESLPELEAAFVAAWVEGRAPEVARVKARLEELLLEDPDVASAHELVGRLEMSAVLLTNLAPDGRDRDAAEASLRRAEEHFARAVALAPDQADACAGLAFCILQRFMLGRAQPSEGAKLSEWVERGREADADAVSVRVLGSWLAAQPGKDPAALLPVFTSLADDIMAQVTARRREPTYWERIGLVVSARAFVFAPTPRPDEAERITRFLLAATPRCRMASRFLKPFVTARTPLEPSAWAELDWEELGGEDDPDGRTPGLPEAVAVTRAIERTPEGDALWIRIHLAGEPRQDVFGVNLVADVDGDPSNGAAWWGGNTDFRFDRLVTAWVARDPAGRYRGAVGITDAAGAYPGEMTNLPSEGVGFGVDLEEGAYVLRVPWKLLGVGEGASLRCVAAVGSNSQWNDDVPDEGSFEVGP